MADYSIKAKPEDIPWEFQAEFGDAGEKERLAQLMAQQRAIIQKGMQPQMVSGHYIRANPMQHLADMLASYWQGKAARESSSARTDVARRMARAEDQAVRDVTGRADIGGEMGPVDPMGAESAAAASPWERVRKIGEAMSKRREGINTAAKGNLTGEGSAMLAATGMAPQDSKFYKPEELYGPPSVIPGLPTPPNGQPVMGQQNLRTQRWNELGGRGSNTSVTVGADKGRGRIIEKEYEYLMTGKGQEAGLALAKAVDNVTSAMNVFSTLPMNTGIDAEWKTIAQKLSQLTGREVDPKAAGTELYQRYVVPMTAEVIKGFGAGTGLSDSDRKFALQAIAQATNDPRMAKIALAFMFRGLMKEAAAQKARISRAQAAAAAEGYDPEMFQPVPFDASIAKEFGLPDGFEKPGVLEKWQQTIMRPREQRLQDAVTRNLGQ